MTLVEGPVQRDILTRPCAVDSIMYQLCNSILNGIRVMMGQCEHGVSVCRAASPLAGPSTRVYLHHRVLVEQINDRGTLDDVIALALPLVGSDFPLRL